MEGDDAVLKGAAQILGESITVRQPRTCFIHGCIQEQKEPLVRFLIQNTTAPLLSGYEAIDSADVVSTYDNSSSSFHWLWRLQDDSLGAGVAWDVASVGSLTLRVYVTTRQEYEPYWLMLCWLGFGLRLAILLAFDVGTTNTLNLMFAFAFA